MRVLLITPPFTQINTPYPATPQLTGFLQGQGYEVEQRDLGLDVILQLLSSKGVQKMVELAQEFSPATVDEEEQIEFFLSAHEDYQKTIASVVRFLQGQDEALALRISARTLLPEGPRFLPLLEHPEILAQFGSLGVRDQAKYLASLYIDDLSDVIRLVVDRDFSLSRYAEQLAESQASFTALAQKLESATHIDQLIEEQMTNYLEAFKPDVIGFSCPFPGNVYGALRAAAFCKINFPQVKTVMGGGFINTELREISDARIFNYIDYLIYDDGELPLLKLLELLEKKITATELVRTKFLHNGEIVSSQEQKNNVPFKEIPSPTYRGLELGRYVSMMELPNPLHRFWSDFRWNKLMLAHGCYWKKCTFCDISLDYISRYEPAKVESTIAKMKTLAEESGQSGFHFVDEAAPPALLKSLSQELLKEGLSYVWWGNLRFDKQFTKELTQLMAEAGCVAVTGGLEVASPRLLKLINKGVDIKQVARVTHNFSQAGILVHAYLMYGYPSQTEQETIDSLEVVRQLFQNGCLKSAHWHRFVATVHSPVGQNPTAFGITLLKENLPEEGLFSRNTQPFHDPTPTNHDLLGVGLRKALYNYMHGLGLDEDVRAWFTQPVPKTTLSRKLIKNYLEEPT